MEYPLCPDCHRPHDVAAALPFPRMSKCSEPNVVIGLLGRLETLHDDPHDDLDLARQEYTRYRWEQTKQDPVENEKLEKVKDEVGEHTMELLKQQEAALEKFNRKMTEIARTWAALDTQAGWLRSEVNTLKALTAVLGRVPDDPKNQASTEGILNELNSDLTIFKARGDAISKGINARKGQKAVNLPEFRVTQSLATGKPHQASLGSRHSEDSGSTSESTDKLPVNNSDFELVELVKAQVDRVSAEQKRSLPMNNARILMNSFVGFDARVQKSPVVDRSPPASRSVSGRVEPSSERTKEDSPVLKSIETQPSACVETKSPSKHTNTEMTPISSVTLAVSPEKSSVNKRSWDDMVEEDLEPSAANSQRRRTGLQTYTSIPIQSGVSEQGQSSAARGKIPVRRDFSEDWRARRGPNQIPKKQKFGSIDEMIEMGAKQGKQGKDQEQNEWPNSMLRTKRL